jgi:hypothetical protein
MKNLRNGVCMTKEDIIRMAMEAGFDELDLWSVQNAIERFAALVAAAEREACAKVCEELEHKLRNTSYTPNGFSRANAIRARGETK